MRLRILGGQTRRQEVVGEGVLSRDLLSHCSTDQTQSGSIFPPLLRRKDK